MDVGVAAIYMRDLEKMLSLRKYSAYVDQFKISGSLVLIGGDKESGERTVRLTAKNFRLVESKVGDVR